MNDIVKNSYEISLWEDIKKYEVYRNGTLEVVEDIEENDIIVNSFYDEHQLAIIGSNTATSPTRVFEPEFIEKVNGEIQLNFSIYSNYYDEEKNEIVFNPFINLLCNERKVKLGFRRGVDEEKEWYDFIIKDIQENSEKNIFTYTATGLFVNELSKTGFELIYDAELESGQGTAEQLGRRALQGSDWIFGGSEVLVEKKVEPLCCGTVKDTVKIYNTKNEEEVITLEPNDVVYLFYNCLSQKSSFLQMMYFKGKSEEEIASLLDSDGVIIDEENLYSYHIDNYDGWIELEEGVNIPSFIGEEKLVPSNTIPRGERIIRTEAKILDPDRDIYVTIYENNEKNQLYRYIKTEYDVSSVVQNLLINGYMFESHDGWVSDNQQNNVVVRLSDDDYSTPVLSFTYGVDEGLILNGGIYDNRTLISNFGNGKGFVLKWKKKEATQDLTAFIQKYKIIDDGKYELQGNPILEWSLNNTDGEEPKIVSNLPDGFSIDNTDDGKIGFFVKKKTKTEEKKTIDFEEIQLFEYIKDADGNTVIPGREIVPVISYTYYFYDPAENKGTTDVNSLIIKKETDDINDVPDGYSVKFNESYNKNRAISISESNRFNIIQTICETFECWADFTIEHEENGKIKNWQDWEEININQLSAGDYYFTEVDGENYSEPILIKDIKPELDKLLKEIFDSIKTFQESETDEGKLNAISIIQEKETERNKLLEEYGRYNEITNIYKIVEEVKIAIDIGQLAEQISREHTKKMSEAIKEGNWKSVLEHELLRDEAFDEEGTPNKKTNGLISLGLILQRIERTQEKIANDHLENEQPDEQPDEGSNDSNEGIKPVEKIVYRRINQQGKYVSFKQYIGKENQAGFKYGINLVSIERVVNSDEIVTKIIVKDNSNQYAENGGCSITRAYDSPTKENFLFNFDYYIKQGLISYTELNNDLYLNAPQYLNYYNKLTKLNNERDSLIIKQSEIDSAILKLESNLTVYKNTREESSNLYVQEIGELKEYLGDLTDYKGEISSVTNPTDEDIKIVAKIRIDKDKIAQGDKYTYSDKNAEGRLTAVQLYEKRIEEYGKLEESCNLELSLQKAEIEAVNNSLNTIAEEKKKLNKKFYEKYSRFIQEGSWVSEDYMDDDLYYFDAESVLYTSSRPQISYTINVIDLSNFEEYKNYSYRIGDKTFIEDVEFFGWKIGASIKTPAQEEVIISEYTHYLDSPEKNVITIQNYKTQFEELFQRITATTNSLQFHSGEYGRAAAVVEPNGTINSSALQNSLLTTSYILENAKNQSVIWDDTGITTTNLTNVNQIVRITSGAIALSNDGGQSWSSAITGLGINANYISAGQIDVSKIRIMNGDFPSFRWTATGLDAYSFTANEDGSYINTNFNKFIRFDQYGIYGIQGANQDWVPKSINEITEHDNLRFALTWDGLRINNDDGSVQIDDKNDITVVSKIIKDGIEESIQRVQIGRLNKVYDEEGKLIDCDYGIRFRDASGAVTMETDDDGQLWLREMLSVGSQKNDTGVRIGYNKELYRVDSEDNQYHEVIHAGGSEKSRFIVYEDGYLEATGVKITGTISATSGSFSGEINATRGTIGKIQITDTGLDIKEGTLDIYNKDGIKVFSINENGGVILEQVEANNGTFNGEITATNLKVDKGTIGGFKIDDTRLYSSDSPNDENPSIELFGKEGKIVAKNIELGTGATIEDYIQLGSARIQNPNNYNGIFINAGNISIEDSGVITAGDITIDGANSTISIGKGITFDGEDEILLSNSWKITPDASYFNNVTISGVLSTAVLEYGEVEAVGGMIFVRPSCLIEEAEFQGDEILLTLKGSKEGFNEGDYCIIAGKNVIPESGDSNISIGVDLEKNYIVKEVLKDGNKIKISRNENSSIDELIDKVIICLGKNKDTAIGINSSNISSFIRGRALSLSELQVDGDKIKYDTKLVLGDLTNIEYGKNLLKGYGLYAENVYLKGKLVSMSEDGNSSSGIDTNGFGEMPTGDKYPWKDDGDDIVIWAGSDNSNTAANAKFIVDKRGNLIANSCYLTGSIISDSTIEAATIRTATIEGIGPEEGYGLTIKDIAKGIVFTEGEKDIFNLSSEKTVFNLPVSINNNLTAKSIVSEESELGDLQIKKAQLSHKESEKGIEFSSSDINIFGKIITNNNETTIETHTFTSDIIKYNNEKVRMEIVEDGYDIYIVSE